MSVSVCVLWSQYFFQTFTTSYHMNCESESLSVDISRLCLWQTLSSRADLGGGGQMTPLLLWLSTQVAPSCWAGITSSNQKWINSQDIHTFSTTKPVYEGQKMFFAGRSRVSMGVVRNFAHAILTSDPSPSPPAKPGSAPDLPGNSSVLLKLTGSWRPDMYIQQTTVILRD